MFHPLIKLLAAKPHLLVQHAGAYAELAALQAGEALRALRRRAALAMAALVALLLGVSLGGVALLLLAVVPLQQMPAPWLLAAAPALPLLLAAGLWWQMTSAPWAGDLAPLQQQWAADARLLDEVGAS